MKRTIFCLAALVFVISAGTMVASAQRWRDLGSKQVDDRVDHDTLNVTGWKGDVRRIKFKVEDAPVRFYHVIVTYGNGRTQRLSIRSLIRRGGETRAINLPGRERVIRKIEFWYEAASLGRKKARVRLYGQD